VVTTARADRAPIDGIPVGNRRHQPPESDVPQLAVNMIFTLSEEDWA